MKGTACKKPWENNSGRENASKREQIESEEPCKTTQVHFQELHWHLPQITTSLKHTQPREQFDSLSQAHHAGGTDEAAAHRTHLPTVTTPRVSVYLQCH